MKGIKDGLLPCPFCGGEAYINSESGAWPHGVYCMQCGVCVKSCLHEDEGVKDAIARWNKRAVIGKENENEICY